MLVLSRKQGERVMIGSNIEVVVLRTEGDRVRLGFIAPRQVPIYREEIAGRTNCQEGNDGGKGEPENAEVFDVLG